MIRANTEQQKVRKNKLCENVDLKKMLKPGWDNTWRNSDAIDTPEEH